MSKLTSRVQVEQALNALRGRPHSIIIQCPAAQAPLLRDIVLGLDSVLRRTELLDVSIDAEPA